MTEMISRTYKIYREQDDKIKELVKDMENHLKDYNVTVIESELVRQGIDMIIKKTRKKIKDRP